MIILYKEFQHYIIVWTKPCDLKCLEGMFENTFYKMISQAILTDGLSALTLPKPVITSKLFVFSHKI